MPAQNKYLSTRGQRAIKICTALVGAYLLTSGFHLFLTTLPQTREVFTILSGISFFVVWASLMVLVFLFKQAWKATMVYLALSLVFYAFTWFIL